jgi:hypothetical protein
VSVSVSSLPSNERMKTNGYDDNLLGWVAGVEAKYLCDERSKTWKSFCLRSLDCAGVCVSEGYSGGYCVGFIFKTKCICTKYCEGGQSLAGRAGQVLSRNNGSVLTPPIAGLPPSDSPSGGKARALRVGGYA